MGLIKHHEKKPPLLSLPKNFISCILYIFIPLAIVHYYFYPPNLVYITNLNHSASQISNQSPSPNLVSVTNLSTEPSFSQVNNQAVSYAPPSPNSPQCDYSIGQWVQVTNKPLYNGTSCGTIKWAQNCMANGRPDTDYLYWRWQPNQCNIPSFDSAGFFEIMKNKHIALIGDSLGRNQVESLLCLLATHSRPELVYHDNEQGDKFRRWIFYEYNTTISSVWSPFLVKGTEKETMESTPHNLRHNTLYLDTANEKWTSELDNVDMIIFSTGHWFIQRAMYYENNVLVGCNGMQEINCTSYSFFEVFRKVINTSLKEVIKKTKHGSEKLAVVMTFAAAHFEGDWDKFGACPKTKPYKEGEVEIPFLENEFRKIEVEEAIMAKKAVKEIGKNVKIEALDITKLAFLRPDGHPGPYMYENPFKDGKKDRVQNDCLHWCLPGPIDMWNEILLDMMKRWREGQGD
ncbi:hypothetical protein LUZ60_003202 [Juncus effusus]|nr:hypothetical protein LUZ60_003202 [Juncus effusus]